MDLPTNSGQPRIASSNLWAAPNSRGILSSAGSWSLLRSDRNTELSMNRQVLDCASPLALSIHQAGPQPSELPYIASYKVSRSWQTQSTRLLSRVWLKDYRPLAFVKADAEVIEHVEPSQEVESDPKMVGEARPNVDLVGTNLHSHANDKYRNQTAITNLDEHSLADREIEARIPGEVAMHNRIRGPGVHIEVAAMPGFVQTQPQSRRRRKPADTGL